MAASLQMWPQKQRNSRREEEKERKLKKMQRRVYNLGWAWAPVNKRRGSAAELRRSGSEQHGFQLFQYRTSLE
eukprot:2285517-Rhodomonas_salina.1